MYKSIIKSVKYLLLSLFTLVIFSSCLDTGVEPDSSESFMPLKIGNKWSYSSITNTTEPDPEKITEIWEAVGTRQIEGKTFSVIKRSYTIPSSAFTDTIYFSLQGNVLYQLFTNDENEPVVAAIANFNLELKDKYSAKGNIVYDITVTNKTADEMSFFFDSPNAVDEEQSYTYKKGSGLYEMFSTAWGVGKRLVKAELK